MPEEDGPEHRRRAGYAVIPGSIGVVAGPVDGVDDQNNGNKNYGQQENTGHPAAAIQLPGGQVITGKTSDLLGASAAVLLNALKTLGGIDHNLHLVSRAAIEPIQALKTDYLGSRNPRLHTDEILIALSISAAGDDAARLALAQLPKLKGCEVHSTVILSSVDVNIFKKLGMYLTCEPTYETKRMFH